VIAQSPEGLFSAVLAAQPGRPLITFYDDADGQRVELSARSMANWVAKTHFLLADSLGLGVGDAALVALPAHWISVAVLFGCWSAGLSVGASAAPADVSVAFTTPATLAATAGVPDVFAVAVDSLTGGFGGTAPAGSSDFVGAVRPQPDTWASVHSPAMAGDPAIGSLTRAEVAARAAKRAADLGLVTGARVLSERPWSDDADWIDSLLAPLTVGASIVLVANADAANRDRRVQQENVTAVI
jgi:uncharacterized protein (TIGR03089 family)